MLGPSWLGNEVDGDVVPGEVVRGLGDSSGVQRSRRTLEFPQKWTTMAVIQKVLADVLSCDDTRRRLRMLVFRTGLFVFLNVGYRRCFALLPRNFILLFSPQ